MEAPDRPKPMGDPPTARQPDPPDPRIAGDKDAADVAMLWRRVDAELRPIIGQRGVVALFNRSVQLTCVAHPWLDSAHQDPQVELQFEAIALLFSRQPAAAAASGGSALLQAFHQLLGSLIGASLTERLLRPAFSPATGALPTQDSSS
jgi:hypothetical protein